MSIVLDRLNKLRIVVEDEVEEPSDNLRVLEESKNSEINSLQNKIDILTMENNNLSNMITQIKSELARSEDLSKSLQAELSNQDEMLCCKDDSAKEAQELLNNKIRILELSLVKAEAKPPQQIVKYKDIPSFECIPQRDRDGKVISVMVNPV